MALLSSLPGILVMIFGFGVLIFVHELGHFLAAKWAGIRTESFAVGMGPVMVSWREGAGLAFGSTARKVLARTGKIPGDLTEDELRRHGLGETEYSLRWLPIGGFVKMLGQDDLAPTSVSSNPRSYTMCPVGKRMIVVSAGVIMNVLLAIAFFVWSFMVGVQFEAPVIGSVSATAPAGRTMPDNAATLGIETPGLLPADRVTSISGKPVRTYPDIAIAAAMSRPGVPLVLTVERAGYADPLRFSMEPELDPRTGLRAIGITPGAANQLISTDAGGAVIGRLLDDAGLAEQGIEPGMRLVEAAGREVRTFEQFDALVAGHGGDSITTRWETTAAPGALVSPTSIEAEVPIAPQFEILRYAELAADGKQDFEQGLLGLVPLTRVVEVAPSSLNIDLLRAGDVVLRLGSRRAPRLIELMSELKAHAGGAIPVTVLRDGAEIAFTAVVSRQGRLGFTPGYAWEQPLLAEPFERIRMPRQGRAESTVRETPLSGAGIAAGSRVLEVDGMSVADWRALRAALRAATATAAAQASGATVTLTVAPPAEAPAVPAPGGVGLDRTAVALTLTADDVAALHALGWRSELPGYAFEPLFTTLSAGESPWQALVMGFSETHKMITMTYLTIDRLIRGTVGVEQLRGPVGIIDLGAKILPKGFMFFVFFLGMISVNLAVLNFLPLPIVDGGLFLFLIYEKIKGTPPSVRFQNAATVVGLFLIGTVFLVTFYNDIMRLL